MRRLTGLIGASLVLIAAPAFAQTKTKAVTSAPLAPAASSSWIAQKKPDAIIYAKLGDAWRGVVRDALGAIERIDADLARVSAAHAFEPRERTVTLLAYRGLVVRESRSTGIVIERGAFRTQPVALSGELPRAGDDRGPRGNVLGFRISFP